MKNLSLTVKIFLLFLISSSAIQAQGINQVALAKQLAGSWSGELSKDTTIYWVIKTEGLILDCSYKYLVKGNPIFEGKQIWNYDSKIDKYKIATTDEHKDNFVAWFTSRNKYVILSEDDISNPERAAFRIDAEFKSPDLFVQISLAQNKPVSTVAYKRVK
jgi:hypothetical protein